MSVVECPHCQRPVPADAWVCSHCGRERPRDEMAAPAPTPEPAPGAPPEPPAYAPVGAETAAGSFWRAEGRTTWVVRLFLAIIVMEIVSVLATLVEMSLLGRVVRGESVSDFAANANDLGQMFIGLGGAALLIVTSIVFLFWLHRAAERTRELGAQGLRFSPGWAVGYYFIPFFNLVRPYQAMKEIWQASDPAAGIGTDEHGRAVVTNGLAWHASGGSSLLRAWWGLFLVSGFVDRMSFKATMAAELPAEMLRADAIYLGAAVLSLVAAWVTLTLIREINQRQRQRAQRLGLR